MPHDDDDSDRTLFAEPLPPPPHQIPLLPADVLRNIVGLAPEDIGPAHWQTLTGIAHEVLRLRMEIVTLRRRAGLAWRAASNPNPN
jgi:hypothetical protein